jgi:hypothetical protein
MNIIVLALFTDCLGHSLTLEMEAGASSETLANLRLQEVT